MKSVRLRKYVKAYEKAKTKFQEVTLRKVPREENNKEDELAWIASTLTLE